MSLRFTERLLRDAGMSPGMKVLDVGCASGGLSCIASPIVKEYGMVVGVDVNDKVLARAKEIVQEHDIANVEFVHADLCDLSELSSLFSEKQFDAIIGRRVLMYLPSPAETIRQLSRFVKPGGLFVFQENDLTLGGKGTVHMPLHDSAVRWIWQTLKCEGADTRMGFNLSRNMYQAGIYVEHVRAEPVIQSQAGDNTLHSIVQAMLPRIVKHGVASEEEIDINTLGERLDAECVDGSIYVTDMAFGAWGHKLMPHVYQ